MHFANPIFYTLIIMCAGLFLLFNSLRRRRERRAMAQIADPRLFERLTANVSKENRRWKRLFYMLAAILILVAVGRPQYGQRKDLVKKKGVDILFVIDTSLSMVTEDTPPNRFERTRLEIGRFIKSRVSDRIGLVPFSGTAHLFCPLTTDLAGVQLFLDDLYVGMIQETGTSISQGLEAAIKAFVKDETKYKAIVLFTDGETLHDSERSAALKAASEAREAGIRIYPVGVGTAAGKPIPIRSADGSVADFKKDRNGKIILSRLDTPLLETIAEKGGGRFLPLDTSLADTLSKELGGLEKKTFEDRLFLTYIERYQSFLFAGFLCYLLCLIIPDRKRKKRES